MSKKCKDCKYIKIKEKAMLFNGCLWSLGTAECKKHGYKKSFKNKFELERLECLEGEK